VNFDPSSIDIVTWARILLKRKKIQRKLSAWARLYGVESAPAGSGRPSAQQPQPRPRRQQCQVPRRKPPERGYWRVAASVRAATNSTIRKASNHETIGLLSLSRSQGEFDYCAPGKSRNQKSQCRLLTTFHNSLNLGQSARNKDSKQPLNTTQNYVDCLC